MANRYWVGGTGDWSDTAHWATTSGGSSGASVPTSSDDVFIDANSGFGSGGTISLGEEEQIYFHDLTCTSGHTYSIDSEESSLFISGSIQLESGLSFTGDFDGVGFESNDSETIKTDGVELPFGLYFNDEWGDGTYTLQDDLTVNMSFGMSNGTFDANDHNVTASGFAFYSGTGYTPTVVMGSGTWEATGNDNNSYHCWSIEQYDSEVVTITPETSTIKFTDSNAYSKSFYFFDDTGNETGKIYNNLWLTGAGTGEFIIYGSNTFNNFKCDSIPGIISFEASKTTTVATFDVSGEVGNKIEISSLNNTSTLTSSSSTGYATSLKSGGITRLSQSFVGNGKALSHVRYYAYNRFRSATGNAYCKIYAETHTTAFGTDSIPTGSPLATSDALDVSTMSSSPARTYFYFSGDQRIQLEDETNYTVVVEYSDSENGIYFNFSSSSNHAGNMSHYTEGDGWGSYYFGYDMYFAVYIFDNYPLQHTLSCASGTIECDYLDISDSNATGGATWYANRSTDSGNNDGWDFIHLVDVASDEIVLTSPSVSLSVGAIFSVNSDEIVLTDPTVSLSVVPIFSVNSDEIVLTSPTVSLSGGAIFSANSDEIVLTDPTVSLNVGAIFSVNSDEIVLTSPSVDFFVSKSLTALNLSFSNPTVSVDWDYLWVRGGGLESVGWNSSETSDNEWTKENEKNTIWEKQ